MIRNYLLVAWKVLLRRKFFTFISLFGICFTLMVLMLCVALVDHVLAPHAPETRLDRSLGIYRVTLKSPNRNSINTSPVGYSFLHRYVGTLPGLEAFSVYTSSTSFSVFSKGREVELDMKQTDANFWRIFDFKFVEGRPFSADEDHGGIPVAVISSAVRRDLFGGQSALGRTLSVEGKVCRVVGVVEAVPILRTTAYADVWVPIGVFRLAGTDDGLSGRYQAVLLVKDARDIPRIQSEFKARLANVEFPDPKQYNLVEASVLTFSDHIASELIGEVFGFDSVEHPTWILFAVGWGAAFLFMLLPAVNLVNINISRILERSSEIGVRKSFGASSGALVMQFVIENLVLVGIGGALGLLLSWSVLQWIAAAELIPHAHFQFNYRIFSYALVMTVFFGVFSGVYPAWRMSRLHPVMALKGGMRA